jgi:hypothetical protein
MLLGVIQHTFEGSDVRRLTGHGKGSQEDGGIDAVIWVAVAAVGPELADQKWRKRGWILD